MGSKTMENTRQESARQQCTSSPCKKSLRLTFPHCFQLCKHQLKSCQTGSWLSEFVASQLYKLTDILYLHNNLLGHKHPTNMAKAFGLFFYVSQSHYRHPETLWTINCFRLWYLVDITVTVGVNLCRQTNAIHCSIHWNKACQTGLWCRSSEVWIVSLFATKTLAFTKCNLLSNQMILL